MEQAKKVKVADPLPLESEKIWKELEHTLQQKTNFYTATHHKYCEILAAENIVLAKCTCNREELIQKDMQELKSFIRKNFVPKEAITKQTQINYNSPEWLDGYQTGEVEAWFWVKKQKRRIPNKPKVLKTPNNEIPEGDDV